MDETPSYNDGNMAHKSLPDDRKLSDYEGKFMPGKWVFLVAFFAT